MNTSGALRGLAIAATLLSLLAGPARADRASLLADLNPEQQGLHGGGGNPFNWLSLGDRVVFSAFEPLSGREPWVSDGSASGTFQLADIGVGSAHGNPRFLGIAAGVAFFAADAAEGGPRELWRTDGTRPGTFALEVSLDDDDAFALAADGLFFTGCSRSSFGAAVDCEPWHSDGTVEGTRRIVDLAPFGVVGSKPRHWAMAGNRALFAVQESQQGSELWATDGTAAGTVRIAQLSVEHAAGAGARAFLLASTSGGAVELWTSDGTAAGTQRLAAFAAADPYRFEAAEGRVLLVADDGVHGQELWGSDGTAAGTVRLTDLPDALGPNTFATVGARVVAMVADAGGARLWVSAAGALATPLVDGCPGGCPTAAGALVPSPGGDRLLFVGSDGPTGGEPWSTDGTAAGTRRLADICPGPCDGAVRDFGVHLGQVTFTAIAVAAQGRQLWVTDGTAAGTRRISAFTDDQLLDHLSGADAGGGFLFAAADSPHGWQPWVTDGTLAGTRLVTLIGVGGSDSLLPGLPSTVDGETALFAACDGTSIHFYRSTGDSVALFAEPPEPRGCLTGPPVGTIAASGGRLFYHDGIDRAEALWRLDPGGAVRLAELPDRLLACNGKLQPLPGGRVAFLTIRLGDEEPTSELWFSDGTPAGTRAIELPESFRFPTCPEASGGRLFFGGSITDSGPGVQSSVWSSDGTAAGTRPILLQNIGLGFVDFGGATYFLTVYDLWRTDGTAAGTTRVWAGPDQTSGSASGLTAFDGGLVFVACKENCRTQGAALWRYSPDTGIATPLHDIERGAGDRSLRELTGSGRYVYFSSVTTAAGRELWRTDGTPAGTVLLRDAAPGPRSSFPSSLLAAPGSSLFFAAEDGAHGVELWRSDGTTAGTRLVQDLAPGFLSSTPGHLALLNDRLLFAADDGLVGREPWSLTLGAPAVCVPAAERLCLDGGRYAVEVRWRDFAGRVGAGHAVELHGGDSGVFWFFGPDNLELVVKVLDGTPLNDHRWVFYGALSSVEYVVTVTDTATGAVKRYVNPAGRLASVGDTTAFGPLGATGSTATPASSLAAADAAISSAATGATVPCAPAVDRLCFLDGRFSAQVAWKDHAGRTGIGQATPLTANTGAFWFFAADNVELLVKVLDGRAVNGSYWLFYGALSDVEYTLTVTDTQTGVARTYRNPAGRMASVGDTSAFPSP